MIEPAKVLVLGESGAGKTHSIQTLINSGVTPFVLFTEPGMRTIADTLPEECHWMYVPAANASWESMMETMKKIGTMNQKSLSSIDAINKKDYQQFYQVLAALNHFVCARTGEDFGDISTWKTDRCIVIDSLTGLSRMAMDMVVGSKPCKNPGDWGIAMSSLEMLLDKLAYDTHCHYVLTGHLEREKDEVTGGVINMPSTLGQKLAPKIPRNFDDVVLASNKNGKYHWSTLSSASITLKARNLPPNKDLMEPSFKPLIKSWIEAGGVIESSPDPIPASENSA
jgi:hypothetical protein